MYSAPSAFVLLARGFGGSSWNRRFKEGKIIGLNEEYAYGYHHAEKHGVNVRYSEDEPEGVLGKLLRFGFRVLLGFDLVHAWRNREAFFAADVVWTHTESQSLAAAALCRLYPQRKAPKLLLQTVWLCDRWEGFGPLRRRLYHSLMAQADVLTFHSPLNLAKARVLFPDTRCELVCFGVPTDAKRPPRPPRPGRPLQLLALGNDRHRDWPTLIEAVRGNPELKLNIASATIPRRLVNDLPNCTVVQPRHNDELYALYENADVVIVPLQDNLHASGITVVQEAVIKGRTVIVSDVGGLRAYFGDADIWYVPPGDSAALAACIQRAANDPTEALARAESAQARMGPVGLSALSFAREHARLSLELLELASE